MKRFKFSLQAVAVLRAHKQLKAQQAMSAAAEGVAKNEAQVAAAHARTSELETMISGARSGPFRPDLQISYLQAYGRERTAEAAAGKALDVARIELAKRRQSLLEAQKQAKVVSQLEVKARSDYRAATLRAEQTEIDERASAAFHRSSSP